MKESAQGQINTSEGDLIYRHWSCSLFLSFKLSFLYGNSIRLTILTKRCSAPQHKTPSEIRDNHTKKNSQQLNNYFVLCGSNNNNNNNHSFIHSLVFALEAGLAGTRAQSCDRYGSGTLHPGQVLGGSLPLLSPVFRRSHFRRQWPVLYVLNDARDPSSERWNCGWESFQ